MFDPCYPSLAYVKQPWPSVDLALDHFLLYVDQP